MKETNRTHTFHRMLRFAGGAVVAATVTVHANCSAEMSLNQLAGGAHFSEAFFNALYSHPVDDSQAVHGRIKNASTAGTSRTKGDVTVELMPESSRGRIDICLHGIVNIDDAVSSRGDFRVFSRSVSQVDARKPVIFDRDGVHDEPASAHCSSTIRICDVQAQRPLTERFAAWRTHRTLDETERILAQRTVERFEDRLNDRIGTAIGDLDRRMRQQLRLDQAELNLLPPEVSFASTEDLLQVWIKPKGNREVSPPPWDDTLDASLDVHIVLHEQVFDRLADYRLADRRLTHQQIYDRAKAWRGNVPGSSDIDSEQPPWSVKMTDAQPLTVRLHDGKIDVVIRLADFQYGPDDLTGPIQVELTLRPEITADGPRMHRTTVPLVRIAEARQSQPSDKDRRLIELLRQKVETIFPPEFELNRQQRSSDDRWARLRHLALTRLNVVHEWFEIGFQLEAMPTPERVTRTE